MPDQTQFKLSTLNLTMNILTYNEMENHVRQHKRINIQLKLVQIQSFLVLSMMARMHKHMIFNFCRLCIVSVSNLEYIKPSKIVLSQMLFLAIH